MISPLREIELLLEGLADQQAMPDDSWRVKWGVIKQRIREFCRHERCNKCGELYTGLAFDCRCTNYGVPTGKPGSWDIKMRSGARCSECGRDEPEHTFLCSRGIVVNRDEKI